MDRSFAQSRNIKALSRRRLGGAFYGEVPVQRSSAYPDVLRMSLPVCPSAFIRRECGLRLPVVVDALDGRRYGGHHESR
jgi:hypothetical protein